MCSPLKLSPRTEVFCVLNNILPYFYSWLHDQKSMYHLYKTTHTYRATIWYQNRIVHYIPTNILSIHKDAQWLYMFLQHRIWNGKKDKTKKNILSLVGKIGLLPVRTWTLTLAGSTTPFWHKYMPPSSIFARWMIK